MRLRESDGRFEAWIREHTFAEFLLYFFLTTIVGAGFQVLITNRSILGSVVGAGIGIGVTTGMTFVDGT